MIETVPPVDPSKRYNEARVAKLLEVDRHTVARWRKAGTINPLPPNLNNLRVYYKGSEVLRAWRTH